MEQENAECRIHPESPLLHHPVYGLICETCGNTATSSR